MFAYGTLAGNWESDGNLANPIMGSTSGSAPIEISEVSGTWRASNGKSYFWPESPNGKISFFGFSPFKVASGSELNASFSKGDGVKFTNYVNSVADAKVTDLMFTTPAIDRTYTSNDVFMGELALEFNHALTQVVFSVKSLETYPNVNINVKSITLKDISSVGSFCS